MKNKFLQDILKSAVKIPKQLNCEVCGITLDSRAVKPGFVFFAMPGLVTDGREYIDAAVKAGASAVISETNDHYFEPTVYSEKNPIPVIPIKNLNHHLGLIAAEFYGHPSEKLKVMGVTGTNGKTSVTFFIADCLTQHGITCGVIGTIGYGLLGELKPVTHTTPNQIELQRMLAELVVAKAEVVAMEVSSHALNQDRVLGVKFFAAVFTNLSRDHLDYHGTMDAYGEAKAKLFAMPDLQFSIINQDDDFGRELLTKINGNCPSIGYTAMGRLPHNGMQLLRASQTHLSLDGMTASVHTPWGDAVLHTQLLGRFQLSNLLAVLAILKTLNVPLTDAIDYIAKVRNVPGRMEHFSGKSTPLIIVDYAHTPDALGQSLLSLRECCKGEIWLVFGCGGERDQGKRPEMGRIAEEYADHLVLTNDNPRREDPETIIADILKGMLQPEMAVKELDRERAIAHAVASAAKDDVVLVAGKGHEDYQIIGNKRTTFSDVLVIQKIIAGMDIS